MIGHRRSHGHGMAQGSATDGGNPHRHQGSTEGRTEGSPDPAFRLTMTTDLTERGLGRLICKILTVDPCDTLSGRTVAEPPVDTAASVGPQATTRTTTASTASTWFRSTPLEKTPGSSMTGRFSVC